MPAQDKYAIGNTIMHGLDNSIGYSRETTCPSGYKTIDRMDRLLQLDMLEWIVAWNGIDTYKIEMSSFSIRAAGANIWLEVGVSLYSVEGTVASETITLSAENNAQWGLLEESIPFLCIKE
jgi:hypothetical protein